MKHGRKGTASTSWYSYDALSDALSDALMNISKITRAVVVGMFSNVQLQCG